MIEGKLGRFRVGDEERGPTRQDPTLFWFVWIGLRVVSDGDEPRGVKNIAFVVVAGGEVDGAACLELSCSGAVAGNAEVFQHLRVQEIACKDNVEGPSVVFGSVSHGDHGVV